MPKFRVQIKLDNYWDYILESSDAEAARIHGRNTFYEGVEALEPEVEVEEVPEDTSEEDVG